MMPGDEEVVTELDDAALFAMASAAAPAHEQEPSAQEDPVAEADTKPQEQQEPPAQTPPEQDHRVPLRELLDERERRQQVAREMEEMRRQNADFQRQLQELRNPQHPIDVLSDPQAFTETIEQRLQRQQQEFDQRLRVHSINTSFSFAARQHGEEFQKAFAALEEVAAPNKGGDLMLRDRIVNSPDPGEAVMQWFRSRQILEESGGDLNAYRERLLKEERERLAKDPEFRKQVMEGLRAEAATRPPITQSPSLNRAPAAASNAGDDERDMSDAELFSYASRPRRR